MGGLARTEDDALLPRQDGRDLREGDEADGFAVGDDENQWPGWPPGERYPLDVADVPIWAIDPVTLCVTQVRVED